MPIDNLQVHNELRSDAHSVISFIDSLLQSGWHSYDSIINKLIKAESIEKTSFELRTIQNHFKKIRELACDKNFIADNFQEYYNEDKSCYDIINERRSGKKKEFKYVDGFKLIDIRLGARITNNLIPFIEYLRQIKGLDDNFDLTLDILEDIVENEGVQMKKQQEIIRVDNRTVFTLSGIQSVQEFLPICRDAIVAGKNLKIIYEPFDRSHINIVISPYMIVEYNNRWSIIGRLVEVKEENTVFHVNNRLELINNFPFDRIVALELNEETMYISSGVNINKILDSAIGTSVNWQLGLKSVEDVVLEFSEGLFPYFVTKPLHKHKEIDSEKFIITYSLIPTLELENIILSYGSGAKVLKPASLRKKIKQRLKETLKMYKE
jgi:predicted DNA-binding transcriptional regulator YafY